MMNDVKIGDETLLGGFVGILIGVLISLLLIIYISQTKLIEECEKSNLLEEGQKCVLTAKVEGK